MAQKIFWNWQQVLTSYEFGQSLMGVLFPGRYCGFDTKAYSGMTLSLTHASSGIIQTDISGTVTTATGVWVNKQGMTVQESATVSIGAVTANASGDPRIDLIIGDYLKPSAAVGSATYQIVTGTPGAVPVAPAVPLPARQVILGYLLVPAGTSVDLASCTFTKAYTPLLGGETRPLPSVVNPTMGSDWAPTDGVSTLTSMDVKKINAANFLITFMSHVYTSTSSAGTVMTLPVGTRPTIDYYIPIITSRFNLSGQQQSILKIATNGVVTIINPAHATDCVIWLRGLVLDLNS